MVMAVRQLATVASFTSFLVLDIVTGEAWINRLLVIHAVFFAFGFVAWALVLVARPKHAPSILLGAVAVDVALIAFAAAPTPYASAISIGFIAVIAAASVLISTGAALLLTAEAVVLSIVFVAWLGSNDQLVPMIVTTISLSAVAIVLIGTRRQERDMRRRLERSERQLRRAETVAQIGSWQWCPATNELHWSRNMYRLLRYDPDGAPITFDAWNTQRSLDRMQELMALAYGCLETGRDYVIDSVVNIGNEPRRVIQARGSRVVDDEGATWLVGTAQDVTELRRVDELKDEFVATASHELRTPATIVLGSVRTLDDRWDELDTATRRRLVVELRRGGERLSQLIEDVLSVTRIEHGTLRVSASSIDLRASIDEVIAALDNERVVPATYHPSVNGSRVMADPDRLRQVLFNLVENALRYDSSGGPVRIDVTVPSAGDAPSGAYLLVSVHDAGPGIAVGDRERIFDRFVRLAGSDAAVESGTGLGLYVARSLVEQHGGSMWVEDGPSGVGIAFCFTLPRA